MGRKGVGHLHQHRYFGLASRFDPLIKPLSGLVFRGKFPELAQFILKVVGLGKRGVKFQSLLQALFLSFFGIRIEVFRVFQ